MVEREEVGYELRPEGRREAQHAHARHEHRKGAARGWWVGIFPLSSALCRLWWPPNATRVKVGGASLRAVRKIERNRFSARSPRYYGACIRVSGERSVWPGRRPLYRTTLLVNGLKPFWHQTLANTSQKALDTSVGGLRVVNVYSYVINVYY